MTEAKPQESGLANSLARPDSLASVPWLEGEVLDQAKGPPPPKSGLGGTSVRRRSYENL